MIYLDVCPVGKHSIYITGVASNLLLISFAQSTRSYAVLWSVCESCSYFKRGRPLIWVMLPAASAVATAPHKNKKLSAVSTRKRLWHCPSSRARSSAHYISAYYKRSHCLSSVGGSRRRLTGAVTAAQLQLQLSCPIHPVFNCRSYRFVT